MESSNTNVNSAAIQDHLMKNFNLGSMDPFGKKKISYKIPSYAKKKPKVLNKRKPFATAGLGIMNSNSRSSARPKPAYKNPKLNSDLAEFEVSTKPEN